VLQMVLVSFWTFSLGNLSTCLRSHFRQWLLPAAASGLLSLGLAAGADNSPVLFRNASIFIVSMGVAGLLSGVPALGFLRRPLVLLGRAAFFVFLFHRALLQAGAAVLRPYLEREAFTFGLIALGLSGCVAVALAKSRSEKFRHVLAFVWM